MPGKNNNHYAILMTITKYPGLSELQGPENDGEAFKAWLTSADGGNVPESNIEHIRTSQFEPIGSEPYDAKPTEVQFKRALNRLLKDATDDGQDWKEHAGERLYLYFAGHGFTAGDSLGDPALYSAIAQLDGESAHIPAYRYADRIASAGFFEEIIVFMDCCQDVLKSSDVLGPTWSPPDRNRSPYVKLLRAIGAPRGKKAFERDLDGDGEVRGLFTVVLLEALRTATPDAEGWVTGYLFKQQFEQIWSRRFHEETGYNPPIRIPDAGDIRIYRRDIPPPEPPTSPVPPDPAAITIDVSGLSLGTRQGLQVRRESPSHPYIRNMTNIVEAGPRVTLPTGVFTIETEGDADDVAFEVLPSEGSRQVGRIEFHDVQPLPKVTVPESDYQVTITCQDDLPVTATILDCDFQPLHAGPCPLSAEIPPGVYKAQLTRGGASTQRIFRVVDKPVTVDLSPPVIQAAVPAEYSSTHHEYHFYPAAQLATSDPHRVIAGGDADAHLLVFVRASQPRHYESELIARPFPWEDLYVSGFNSAAEDWRQPLDDIEEQSYYGGTKVALPAGMYWLRSQAAGSPKPFELGLPLATVPGWRTEIYVDSLMKPAEDAGTAYPLAQADFSRASVYLVRLSEPSLIADRLGALTELARISLFTNTAPVLPAVADIQRSPMLGIYTAYALYQQSPEQKADISYCLQALPEEVRALTDVKLLQSWLDPQAAGEAFTPLDIPMLNAGWYLSRKLPEVCQLTPILRGAIGQWRVAGSQWTSWLRPEELTNAEYELASGQPDPALRYDQLLSDALADPTRYSAGAGAGPCEEVANWADYRDRLDTPAAGLSAFQQSLRRLLLDSIALDEPVTLQQVLQLGAQLDLDPHWIELEYRQFLYSYGLQPLHVQA